EDLATDRIYRYMISQRVLHQVEVPDTDGKSITHSPELVTRLFDEELERLVRETPAAAGSTAATLTRAREQSEGMILGILEAQSARAT
ncbi:MAG TPA: hypothetical protein VGD57_07440, partial [Candidatus Dormibacteraeota bacterium]